jgi:hypothetical protein
MEFQSSGLGVMIGLLVMLFFSIAIVKLIVNYTNRR